MSNRQLSITRRLVAGSAIATALAGCSSAGTIMRGDSTTGRNTSAGNGTTGDALTQPSATRPGTPTGKAGPKWVISMPDSIAGFPRVEPDSENVRQFDSAMRTVFQVPGVTGQTMRGIYDDARDDYYLVVYGVNGSGINPADVVSTTNGQKANDDQADPITLKFSRVDPGPHGGDDSCADSTITQPFDGGLGPTTVVSENTVCMWSTTTTAGSVAFVTKGDLKQSGFNGAVTPTIAGQTMLAVRDAVEHRHG